MDCRNSLLLAMCLAFGANGCLLTTTTTSGVTPPPGAVVTKPKPSGPPRKPDVEMLVTLAKTRVGQAEAEKNGSLQNTLYNQGREYYQEALKTNDKCLPAYQGLAQVYLRLNEFDRAVETLLKATRIAPNTGCLWFDLANSYNCRKEWDQAAQCLYTALQIEPEKPEYKMVLGVTLAHAGRIDESLAVLTQAYHSAACAHLMIALTFRQLHQLERCKEHLELAKRANPNAPEGRDIDAWLASLEQPSAVVPAPMIAPDSNQ